MRVDDTIPVSSAYLITEPCQCTSHDCWMDSIPPGTFASRDSDAQAMVTNATTTPAMAGRAMIARPRPGSSLNDASAAASARFGARRRHTSAARIIASHTRAAVMVEYAMPTAPKNQPASPVTANVSAGPMASAQPSRSPEATPSSAPGRTSKRTNTMAGQITVMRLRGSWGMRDPASLAVGHPVEPRVAFRAALARRSVLLPGSTRMSRVLSARAASSESSG